MGKCFFLLSSITGIFSVLHIIVKAYKFIFMHCYSGIMHLSKYNRYFIVCSDSNKKWGGAAK